MTLPQEFFTILATMIKYIIFDFDGTLADSREVFISVFNQIAEKHNYRKMEAENLHHLRTLTITERCRYLKVPLYRIPFLATEFLSLYKKALQNVVLFEGIKELLEALNSIGYEMAIISSNAESNISDFLKSNGIGTISKIYCSTSLFGKDKLIKGFLKSMAFQMIRYCMWAMNYAISSPVKKQE